METNIKVNGRMIISMVMVKLLVKLGVYEYADGNKYDGDWKDNLKSGYGKVCLRVQENIPMKMAMFIRDYGVII